MKVKNVMHNGQLRWIVDGRINGKRNRLQFDNEKQATTWLKAHERNAGDSNQTSWWTALSNGERADIMNAFERSREMGFSLLDAVHYYGVQGRGKTFLKKMSLKEAVGELGGDKRLKNYKQGESKPSGFLAAKARKGCTPRSLSSLGWLCTTSGTSLGGTPNAPQSLLKTLKTGWMRVASRERIGATLQRQATQSMSKACSTG